VQKHTALARTTAPLACLAAIACVMRTARCGDTTSEDSAPPQPTVLLTRLQLFSEWSHLASGDVYGLRFQGAVAPGGRNLFLLELPLQRAHFQGREAASGVGDLRFRYFGLPYYNPQPRAHALGLSLDIFAPTGDPAKGLGLGDWVFAPGLLVGLRVNDSFTVFPNFSYVFATGPTSLAGSGGLDPLPPGVAAPSAEDTRGFILEIQGLIRLPKKGYLWVNPTYVKMTSGADLEAFNLRLTYGVPVNTNTHFTVSYLHEFANRDRGMRDQLRLGVARYF
jgi:hypothetical protein